MTQECARRLGIETGGILAGRYDKDLRLAKVSIATAPPPDSAGGHAWFKRGTAGLKRLLDQLWSVGDYYLGEWHFHPGGAPSPSGQDIEQLRIIASDLRYACPEPLLVILGGRPPDCSIASVVWDGGRAVPLLLPFHAHGSS